MKQSYVHIFTIFWGLQILGGRGGKKLMDFLYKAVKQKRESGAFDLSDANYVNIINFVLSTLGNSH